MRLKLAARMFTPLARGIFGGRRGVLNKVSFKEERDENNIPLTYIGDKPVRRLHITLLGSLALFLFMYTGFAFWDVFLLTESTDCDSRADCFVDGGGYDPVDNCTDILLANETTTVTCYKFSLAVGTAIGVSGGIITALGLTMSVVSGFWIFCYNLLEGNVRAFKVCKFVQISIAFMVPITILIILTLIEIKFSSLQLQPHTIIQVFCLSLTFIMGLAFPWWHYSRQSSSSYQVMHGEDVSPKELTSNHQEIHDEDVSPEKLINYSQEMHDEDVSPKELTSNYQEMHGKDVSPKELTSNYQEMHGEDVSPKELTSNYQVMHDEDVSLKELTSSHQEVHDEDVSPTS